MTSSVWHCIIWGIPQQFDQNSVKLTPPHFLFWWTFLQGDPVPWIFILTFPDPWGQRFQSYSLGHFREVTLQDNLWRPIAPKPMHRTHQKCTSTWSQWVEEHFCDHRLKKNEFFDDFIYFSFSYLYPFPQRRFCFLAAFWSLNICLEMRTKLEGCSFENIFNYFLKNLTFCQCSIIRRLP